LLWVMNDLLFCIKTTDRTVLARWQNAFEKEGWKHNACDCLGIPCTRACRVRLDLVEVTTSLCKTPEDLQTIIRTRKSVATLAFAPQQSISNSQIAKFLEFGADDFVFNNLDERILVAKLKAHIRRLTPHISATIDRVASGCGDIEIDRSRRAVKIKASAGKYTELSNLTQKELDILSMLVGNEQRIVSRESMLEKLWGSNATEVYSECIDKHVESLRRKLGLYGKKIRTVYGSGYMFTGGKNP